MRGRTGAGCSECFSKGFPVMYSLSSWLLLCYRPLLQVWALSSAWSWRLSRRRKFSVSFSGCFSVSWCSACYTASVSCRSTCRSSGGGPRLPFLLHTMMWSIMWSSSHTPWATKKQVRLSQMPPSKTTRERNQVQRSRRPLPLKRQARIVTMWGIMWSSSHAPWETKKRVRLSQMLPSKTKRERHQVQRSRRPLPLKRQARIITV